VAVQRDDFVVSFPGNIDRILHVQQSAAEIQIRSPVCSTDSRPVSAVILPSSI